MARNHMACYSELVRIARGDDRVARDRLDAYAAYARGRSSPVRVRRPSMLLFSTFLLGGLTATILLAVSEPATRDKIFAYFNFSGTKKP